MASIHAPVFLPANEAARQAAVDRAGLRRRGPSAELQAIVEAIARHYAMPLAAVTIIDRDRQWFAARHGIKHEETSRAVSFCAHTILHPGEPMVVLDTARDDRFADNPFVVGAPNVRFYAGVPLVDQGGYSLGTLCMIDTAPYAHSPDLIELGILARRAERIIAR